MTYNLTRSLTFFIDRDLRKKMVILSGPRQCGKTTLAKALPFPRKEYLNYDSLEDRSQIIARHWDRSADLILFDELHKMPMWKAWLKGIYDTEKRPPYLLVTDSARLDTFKKTGDSLAGRHFYFRLHPLDLRELKDSGTTLSPEQCLNRILSVGGYPEPFLSGEKNEYHRWRKTHLDLILRQDLPDLHTIRDTRFIVLLIELLRARVGSGVSTHSLATELGRDSKTVQSWLNLLEDLFVIFKLTPFARDIASSLKKEPKYYFYDVGLVEGPERLREGARLENAIACSLLKECHRLSDALGVEFDLHYLKVKGGREIDFAVIPRDREHRSILIESKWAETDASPNFKLFANHFKNPVQVQLVKQLARPFHTPAGVHVARADEWLWSFDLLEPKSG